jgi:hypothetical protein
MARNHQERVLMKTFFCVLFFSLSVFAQYDPNRVVEGGYFPNAFGLKNYVKNSTCDKNALNITAGATMSVSASASNKIKGAKSCALDAGASADTATWAWFASEQELYGQNCESRFQLFGDGSLYNVGVLVGGNPVVTSVTLPNAISGTQVVSLNFPCPVSSGQTVATVVKATGDGAAITVDDVYGGLATNLGKVSQATLIGSAIIANTTNCLWSRTNTALGSFGSDADCPGPTVEINAGPGVISTTDTDLPKFTVANLPPGQYQVIATSLSGTTGANETICQAINDGTNTRGATCAAATASTRAQFSVVANFSYASAGSRTFEIYGSAGANAIELSAAAGNSTVTFQIYRFPSTSELALTPNTSPAYWSGYHGEDCIWSVTSAAYAAFTADASCTMAQRQASNISCAATGSVLPSIACTLPKTGAYYVCANGMFLTSSASQGSGIQLWDGTTIIVETMGGSQQPVVSPVCGVYVATSLTPTFSLRGKASSGAMNISRNAAGGAVSVLEWTIVDISQSLNVPILVGSVTSSATGAQRSDWLAIDTSCTSTPCTIARQSGPWATSVTRASAGRYTLNIVAGMFSATPVIMVRNIAGGSGRLFAYGTCSSATTCTVDFDDGAAAGTDTNFELLIMGPK